MYCTYRDSILIFSLNRGRIGALRRLALHLVVAVWFCQFLNAQNTTPAITDSLPSFEVISIRAHEPGYWPSFEHRGFTRDGFEWLNAQTQSIIVYAYDLRDPKLGPNLIPGAPKWIRSDWYDIRAKLSAANVEKMRQLNAHQKLVYQRQFLQALLLDRFNLRAHLISKPSLAYELVVAKHGPKNIKEAKPGESPGIDWVDAGYGQYHAVPIEALITLLQMQEDCPVIDRTGLKAAYDFELKWERAPETMPPPRTSIVPSGLSGDPSRPSIFKALEEQLGLKLNPIKQPLEGIVIDHIDKPSPN